MARSYLALTQDVTRVMNRLKAIYRSWAIPCAGQRVYRRAIAPSGLGRSAKPAFAAGRRSITSNSTRCVSLRQQATTRAADGRPQAPSHEVTSPDSFDRPHSVGSVDCNSADTASFPHQAATMGLQRAGVGDTQQRGISLRGRPTQRSKKVLALRGLNKNHNHDLKNIFKGAAIRA